MKPIPSQVRVFPHQLAEFCTTAVVNGQAVCVELEHRWEAHRTPTPGTLGGGGESVVCTVSAPIALTLTDAALILYHWEVSCEDLADDDTVRTLIAEGVVSWGCWELGQRRFELVNEPPRGADAHVFAYCRRRAATVLGLTPQTPTEPGRTPCEGAPTRDPVTDWVVW